MGKHKTEGPKGGRAARARQAAMAAGQSATDRAADAAPDLAAAETDLVLVPAGAVQGPLTDHLIRLFSLRTILTRPTWLATSDWLEHVPFAFWLTEALRPRLLVDQGAGAGVAHFAFCQAAERLGLDLRAFAIDDWTGRGEVGLRDRLEDHNQALYSAFSRLVDCPPQAAPGFFPPAGAGAGDGIDLLQLNGETGQEALEALLADWLPRLSDRAVVLLPNSNLRAPGAGVVQVVAALRSRFPVFEFTHGQGLAVVGIGPRQGPAMARLFALDGDAAARQAIHAMFGRLGRACADAQDLRQAREGQRMAEAALAALRGPSGTVSGTTSADLSDSAALIARLTAERDAARENAARDAARAGAQAAPAAAPRPETQSGAEAQELRQSLAERNGEIAALTAMVLDHQRAARLAESARDAALRDQSRSEAVHREDLARLQAEVAALTGQCAQAAGLRDTIAALQAELAAQRPRLEELDGALQAARARSAELTEEARLWQQRHEEVLRSTSWRLSAPIRAVSRVVRRSPPG